MKVSISTWFGLLIGLAASVQISQAVTGAAMVGTVLDGADKVGSLLQKVDAMLLKPIIEGVKREIEKIDITIEGLTAEEKELIIDSKIKLLNARSDILRTRTVLNILADETIKRCKTLLKILRIVLNGKAPTPRQQIGIKLAVKKMNALLRRSQGLLADAREYYEDVQTQLNEVHVKVTEFSKRVVELSDTSSTRYTDRVDEMRATVYGASAACLAFAPSCVLVYPAAAAILETQISDWKAMLGTLVKRCDNSKNNANDVAARVKDDIAFLQEEERLITEWESKITMMYEDFEDGDYIQNAIDMEEFDKGYSINKILDLIAACRAYKAHSYIVKD